DGPIPVQGVANRRKCRHEREDAPAHSATTKQRANARPQLEHESSARLLRDSYSGFSLVQLDVPVAAERRIVPRLLHARRPLHDEAEWRIRFESEDEAAIAAGKITAPAVEALKPAPAVLLQRQPGAGGIAMARPDKSDAEPVRARRCDIAE